MGHWGAQEGNPVCRGKIMPLALNKESLKSLWVVPVEFEVGS